MFFKLLIYFISFIIFIIILTLSLFIQIRFGRLNSERLGHYVFESLLYLHKKKEDKKKSIDIFYNQKKVCNKYFYKLLKLQINFVPFFIGSKVEIISNFFFKEKNPFLVPRPEYSDRDLDGYFYKNKIKFNIPQDDIVKGIEILKEMGLKKNDKYICLAVRDSNYLNKNFPDKDWNYHNFRNCNIENFIPTIKFLIKKGYTVIRVGKDPEKKLNINIKKFIDYPFTKYASDFMDVFLPFYCHFYISTGFGADSLAGIKTKPILYVSYSPLGYINSFQKKSLCIFKKYFSKNTKKYLSVKQIMKSNLSTLNSTDLKKKI